MEITTSLVDRLNREFYRRSTLTERFARAFAARGFSVLRYRDARHDSPKGGWKHVGGANMFIDPSGTITAGCPGVKGEDVDDIEDEPDESRDHRAHRQDVAEEKGLKGEDVTQGGAKNLEEHPHPETGENAEGKPVAATAPAEAPAKPAPDLHSQWRDLHREHKEHAWIHVPAAEKTVSKAMAALMGTHSQIAKYRDAANLQRSIPGGDTAKAREYERKANELVDAGIQYEPALKAVQQALTAAHAAREQVAASKAAVGKQAGIKTSFNALDFDPGSGTWLGDENLKPHQKAVKQEWQDRQKAAKESEREQARAAKEAAKGVAKAEKQNQREKQREEEGDADFDFGGSQPKPKLKINPRTRFGAAVLETANDWGIAPDDLADAVQYTYEEKSRRIIDREKTKADVHRIMGLHPSDVHRMEDAGMDYTSLKRSGRLRQFDVFAVEVARQHPDLGLNPDDPNVNLSEAVWDLLKEKRQKYPAIHDPEILREAANLVLANQGSPQETLEPAYAEDFRKRGAVERYRRWQAERVVEE